MKKLIKISASELEVLQVLWNNDNTATSTYIHQELSKTKEWKLNTVITFLARLCDKGYVKANKKGRGKANQYIAIVTEEKYKQMETHMFLDTVHRGSVKSLMTALCEDKKMSDKELEELRQWFQNQLI